PDSPEVISRTFLMEVSVGHFDRALALAPKELKLDPSDAIAQLVLLSERLKTGDAAGALKYATALPSDGVHRFMAPFALAWTRVAGQGSLSEIRPAERRQRIGGGSAGGAFECQPAARDPLAGRWPRRGDVRFGKRAEPGRNHRSVAALCPLRVEPAAAIRSG